ncbi:asparaginase [Vagococcus acidifermentans]|uniref:asparaginase n=1 Tax=Vagococcus acidifermentans TaxID=564710 RepID=A0A430AXS1_9ENTE|nr:asparaginase [Vagococcus acidifermentans]RSU12844.1 L-asparaginase [Vagococcus acidifermentans]
MKKILVIHTGGTISMKQETDGTVTLSAENPLLGKEDLLPSDIQLFEEEIFNLPSPHIRLEDMLAVKRRIDRAQEEGFYGVVVTHGTDTLEETAYFLDVTLEKRISVVLTGAMRSSNEIGSDGLYNFIRAVITAANADSANQGVLVVFNDEIHSAQFVTKTHTTNVNTFRTPTFGPVGLISKNGVYFVKEAVERQTYAIETVAGTVPLLKAYAGMDGTMFEMCLAKKVDGLVIEAFGAGNLPPSTLPAVQALIDSGIPIALVSRCSNGMAEDIYDYQGGGVGLKKMGVMFVKGLTGQKARIRLIIGINAGLSGEALIDFMTV